MTKKKTNHKNNSLIQDKANAIITIDKVVFWGLMIALLLIPIIIRANVIDFVSPSFTNVFTISTSEKIEIYSYEKYKILLFITIILSFLFMIKVFIFNYSIKKNSANLTVAAFILVLLFSSIFATYKYMTFNGMYDRHEGTISFLCYTVLFFIASNTIIPKNHLKWAFYSIIPFTIINCIIGVLNFYGVNVLNEDWVARLIKGEFAESYSFSERSILMGTLEQGNYLSGVSSMLFITFFILAILCANLKQKVMYIILVFSSFGILLASLSNSGFITISLLVPLFLLILVFNKKYKEVAFGLSLIVSLSLVFIPMYKHNETVWSETFGNYSGLNPFANEENPESDSVQNKENAEENATKEKVENFIPQLPEPSVSWGNGRGYIWKTTIPLITERPVLGYGLGTYIYHFPQNDKNMIGGLGTIPIVSKPHSLYLDIAFGTGVLGLLIFLTMVLIPLWKSAKYSLFKKNVLGSIEILALTFLALAYLVQGLVNDPVIGVSVIFYVLLGVLTSILTQKETENLRAKGTYNH